MKQFLKKPVFLALLATALAYPAAHAETMEEREERLFQEQSELLKSAKGQMLYQLGLLGSSAATLETCKGGASKVKAFEKVFRVKALDEYIAAGGSKSEFFNVYDGSKKKTSQSKPKPSAENCKELAQQIDSFTQALK